MHLGWIFYFRQTTWLERTLIYRIALGNLEKKEPICNLTKNLFLALFWFSTQIPRSRVRIPIESLFFFSVSFMKNEYNSIFKITSIIENVTERVFSLHLRFSVRGHIYLILWSIFSFFSRWPHTQRKEEAMMRDATPKLPYSDRRCKGQIILLRHKWLYKITWPYFNMYKNVGLDLFDKI